MLPGVYEIKMKISTKKPDMGNWSEERKKTFACIAVEEPPLTLEGLNKNLINAVATLNKEGKLIFKRIGAENRALNNNN